MLGVFFEGVLRVICCSLYVGLSDVGHNFEEEIFLTSTVTVGYSYRLLLLLSLAKIRSSLTYHLQVMSLTMSLEVRPW